MLNDLILYQKDTGNINDYKYRIRDIQKIVKNRTTDKMWFLNYLFNNKYIDREYYIYLKHIVENDYRLAKMCICNFISAVTLI